MKITLRPYANDKTRFHVDIRFMNPCNEPTTRSAGAWSRPPGLMTRQARRVGGTPGPADPPRARRGTADAVAVAQKEIITMRAPRLTLAEFYERRFLPEHVALQKRATRDSYESLYRNHIGPQLGDVPIAVIDEDRISEFRAALHKRVGITTANVVLGKLAKILKKAKKLKAITVLPDVERFPVPRARPKPVFSDVEIARLSEAAADRSPDALLVCLLALDANLRVSEICALQWTDINLEQRTITVQHNVYKGEEQTPKGEIKTIALSSGVLRALAEHRKRGELGTAGPLPALAAHRLASGHPTRRTASGTCSTRRRSRGRSRAAARTCSGTPGSPAWPTSARASTPSRRWPATRACRPRRRTSTSTARGSRAKP
jgi:integrase